MAVRGVEEDMRDSSASTRGEKCGDGGGGRRGWGVVGADWGREEDMRVFARATDVGVGGRSMSANDQLSALKQNACGVAYMVESRGMQLLMT